MAHIPLAQEWWHTPEQVFDELIAIRYEMLAAKRAEQREFKTQLYKEMRKDFPGIGRPKQPRRELVKAVNGNYYYKAT